MRRVCPCGARGRLSHEGAQSHGQGGQAQSWKRGIQKCCSICDARNNSSITLGGGAFVKKHSDRWSGPRTGVPTREP